MKQYAQGAKNRKKRYFGIWPSLIRRAMHLWKKSCTLVLIQKYGQYHKTNRAFFSIRRAAECLIFYRIYIYIYIIIIYFKSNYGMKSVHTVYNMVFVSTFVSSKLCWQHLTSWNIMLTFKGIVSRDFLCLQMIFMDRKGVSAVPRDVYFSKFWAG